MIEIDGDCRIRDAVRDSKIRKDIPSKPYQKIDSFASEEDRVLDGWRHHLYYGNHQVGRDFPRTTQDGVAAAGFNIIEPEGHQVMGVASSFDEVERWFHYYMEKEAPFLGMYRKNTASESIIERFKRNLPDFDGFWHGKDLLNWIDAIEDFFEETNPPEKVKCEIVWYKMKGRAYYWWKQLQQERIDHGKEEITSWAMMKKLVVSKFSPARCSTKCPKEKESPKQSEDSSPSDSSHCVDVILETPINETVEEINYILEPENCEENNNDDDLDESFVEEQSKQIVELKPAACSTKVRLKSDIETLEKTTSHLLMPTNGPVPMVSLSVITSVGFSKALNVYDHMGNELFYEFGRVGCKHFDPGGIRRDMILWFPLTQFSHGPVEIVEMEKQEEIVMPEGFDPDSMGLEHIVVDTSQEQLLIEAKCVTAVQKISVEHEDTNASRAMNVGPQVMFGKLQDPKTLMPRSLADGLIEIYSFITSRFGKELGCKVHKVEKELIRNQTLWRSNEVDILVDEMVMFSFDPGGTKSDNALRDYWQDLSAQKDGCVARYNAIVLWVLYRHMDYCLVSRPNSTREPMFWICNQNCWYTNGGWKIPHRPVEDLAFTATHCFHLNEFEDLHSHNDEWNSVVALNTVNAFFLVTPLLLKCCLTKVCVVRMNALSNPIAVLSFMFDAGGKCGDDNIYRLNAWSLARDNYYIYNGFRAHMEIKPLVLAISTFDIGMVLQVFLYRKHEGNLENEVSQEHSLPRITPLENKVDVVICVTGEALIYVLSGSKGLAVSRPHGGCIIKCVKGKSLKLELSGWEHHRMIQCELLACAYNAEIAILLGDTLCMIFDPGGNLRNRTKSKDTLDLTLESGCAGTMDDPILVTINVHRVHLVDCSDTVYGIGIVWLVSALTMDITLQSFSIYSRPCIGFRDSATILEFLMLQVVLPSSFINLRFLLCWCLYKMYVMHMGFAFDLGGRPESSQSCGLKLYSYHVLNICSKNETSNEFFLVKLSHLGVCSRSKSVHEDCEFLGQPDMLVQLVEVLISDFLFVWDEQYIDDSGISFSFYLTRGRVHLSEGWNDKVNGNTERRRLAVTNLSVFTLCTCVIILCYNEDFMKTLKVFYKLVNGLDPPKRYIGESGDVFAALDSSSYWIHACGQAFQVGGWR